MRNSRLQRGAAMLAVPAVLAIAGTAAATIVLADSPSPSPAQSSPVEPAEPADTAETTQAAEAPGMPDAGHADPAGNVDNQFEGEQ